MLQTVDVAELRPGMYVQKLLGPWMQHPFWRTSFVLDEARLAQLQDSGVEQVVVDLSRSHGDAEDGGEEEAVPASVDAPPVAEPAEARRRPVVHDSTVSLASELVRARRICDEGREAVEALFREVRLGNGVDAGRVLPLLDEITGSVDRHPTALVSVARLKDADSYTYLHSIAVGALMAMLARQLQLPEEQVRDAPTAVRPHDDQLDSVHAGITDDFVRRFIRPFDGQDRRVIAGLGRHSILHLPQGCRFVVAWVAQHGAHEHVVNHVQHVETRAGTFGEAPPVREGRL